MGEGVPMCLTLPVRVLAVRGAVADVDVAGQPRVASTVAVPSVAPGDWAILSAGLLVRVLDPASAALLADAYRFATSTDGATGASVPETGEGAAP
jgi:hydrogenase expression/formation protein HypC